jgi:quercetin dioxygenase-like cupin family protein
MTAPLMADRRAGNRVLLVGPGEGRPIPGREEIVLKATGSDTAGAVAVLEATTEPSAEPDAHVHHHSDELFYVLEGQMRFRVGEGTIEAPVGTFLFVPRGTVHAAWNAEAAPARVLAAYVPAGPERDLEAFAQAPAEERDRLARESSSEFVAAPKTAASEG